MFRLRCLNSQTCVSRVSKKQAGIKLDLRFYIRIMRSLPRAWCGCGRVRLFTADVHKYETSGTSKSRLCLSAYLLSSAGGIIIICSTSVQSVPESDYWS